MTKTARILSWLLLTGVVLATLLPIEYRPVSHAPVGLERFGAFALLSFAFGLGYPHRRWQVLALLIVAASSLEALQTLELTRHGRFGEFMVKASGCGFGAVVAFVLAFIPACMAKAEGRA